MDLGYAIVKGVVQGLTEFLPVSSTAHLVFTDALSHLLHWQAGASSPQEEEFFNILVQVGTLGAVIYFFRVELVQIVRAMLGQPVNLHPATLDQEKLPIRQLPVLLAISTVCTVVFTLVMLKGSEMLIARTLLPSIGVHDLSELGFHFPQIVAGDLFMTGVLLFLSQKMLEHRMRKTHQSEPVGTRQAVTIGFFQGFSAIFHGLSRSGSTISAGLMSGLDRVTATRYTFLLSIPTFLLATVYESYKFYKSGHIAAFSWAPMLVGTAVAGVVGYFCIKAFLGYIARHSLVGFALYCWIVGGGFFIFFLLNPSPDAAPLLAH